MGEGSKIEWTDHTFNPWVGCLKVSPACDHCYAESWAKRSGMVTWGEERRRTSEANWRAPLRWNRQAEAEGVRKRVFCASLADVFDNEVPDEWRADLFDLIEKTQHLEWLLLTKRISNVRRMLPTPGVHGLPANVWLGISVVNQEEADRDIPKLGGIPATIRFLSCEPLLGPLDIQRFLEDHLVDWVIVGGESGGQARHFDWDWAREIRRQCWVTQTPFFMKQGSQAGGRAFKDFDSFPPNVQVRQWPKP